MKRKSQWENPPAHIADDIVRRVREAEAQGVEVPAPSLIKTPEQIEGIRRAGVANTEILDAVAREIHAGMTTEDIDRIVVRETAARGATAAPLHYEGFPKSVCVSIDEEVCHGIPSPKRRLHPGEIVNVDCTTIVDGFFADASRMFVVGGQTTAEKQRLVDVARECLRVGIEALRPWGLLGEVGRAIQRVAKANRMTIVRDLCGHGVGNAFHEEPDVDHYDTHKPGMLLVPGMVLTVEPMVNLGKRFVFIDEADGWTVVTEDERPSAQWEHTLLITADGVEVLTY